MPQEPQAGSLSTIKIYVLATRPQFLSASFMAVLLGLAAAHYQHGTVNAWLAVFTLLGALLIQAGVNVLNDYYDALNGTDEINQQRIYPFTGGSRFIQNGILDQEQTAVYGALLIGAAGVIGFFLMAQTSYGLLLLGMLGFVIGWGYSAPPLNLNSRGLGELAVGLGFGIIMPCGSDFVQRGEYSLLPLLIGVPYGLLITNLLYVNQFPDCEADRICAKRHLVVRLGKSTARWLYLIFALASYAWLAGIVAILDLPDALLLALLPLPLSLFAARQIILHADEPWKLTSAIRATILAAMGQGAIVSAVLFLV